MLNETITIAFSISEDSLAMLRLAVSSLAARKQFDVDKIEDLTTALCEVCNQVSAYAKSGEQLTVALCPGVLFAAKVSVVCAPEYLLPPHEKSGYLIRELVDHVDMNWEPGKKLSIEIRLNR